MKMLKLFYELVQLARNKDHMPFGSTGRDLMKRGLIDENMGMHRDVRDIIVCSVEGDGLDMRMVNPLAVQ